MSGSQPGRMSRVALRWIVAVLLGLVAAAGIAMLLVAWSPAFYASGSQAISEPGREQAARRMVTKVSSLHAGLGRPGRWEAAISTEEVNAWLELDLPRNHPTLLPSGVRKPHVSFEPKRIKAGARIGYGIASAVAWIDAEVVLRDINQLQITLEDARIGLVPVPRGLVLDAIAKRVAPLGAVTEVVRMGDRPAVIVYIPSVHGSGLQCRLEGLRIDAGEAVVEGVTRKSDPP